MKYVVVIEKGTDSWGAYVPDLPGCALVAETRETALKLIRGAVDLHIEGLRETGSPIPEPRSAIEYVQV
ncbi:MAG TPA: type II toxin-antitoxin system HicB family antitoxin [Terriglobia bacterium]|nr:type II toxin-antitoxin system HicB family antitoxin [Terriglobia bacterium]